MFSRVAEVGLVAVFELSGSRSTYKVRALVTGVQDHAIQLRLPDGRHVEVPTIAVLRIEPIAVERLVTGVETQTAAAAAPSQADIARALRIALDEVRDEAAPENRVAAYLDQLENVQADVSSNVNRRLIDALIKAGRAVQNQIANDDHAQTVSLQKLSNDLLREARKNHPRSTNSLTTALGAYLQRLTAEHEDYWQMVKSASEHPPTIVTRDRVNVTRGYDHEFDLPVRVTLDGAGAELRDVTVVLDKYRNLQILGRAAAIEKISGGQTVTITIRLRDNRKQGARAEVRVDAHLKYMTIDGRSLTSPRQTLVLSIRGNEARSEIPNPYRPYAGGLPVSNPDMFFGRDTLIRDLVRDLGKTPGGTCFALYGQQRIGKSSVLEQVKNKLTERRAIVAALSMGTLDRRSITIGFIEEILDQYRVQIDRVLPADMARLLLDRWPTSEAVEHRPLRSLQRALEAGRSLMRSAGLSGIAFVVVVDEFTYIHEILRRRGVDPSEHNELKDFMRQLKGLLEARMFSALLIGQDTMPRFLESYPNEFSVMSTRKLDYLTADEAQSLADAPIRTDDGISRYTGYALATIATYTGGHPFFTQILCDRVITLVNSHHRSDVTQSDVEEAVESLLSGRDRIETHKFDCLVTADNSHSLIGSLDEDDEFDGTARSLAVLQRIANLSGSQNVLVPIDHLQLDSRQKEALDDLLLRGVLHRKDDAVNIRVLLYADYLRRNER